MTSETSFAEQHTSTWRMLTPTIDIYIRRINLELYERQFPPLQSEVRPDRRGFVNEVAFNIFCEEPRTIPLNKWADSSFTKAVAEAKLQIAALGESTIYYSPTFDEIDDIQQQVYRYRSFFYKLSNGGQLELRPHFRGSGIIDSCDGDIYVSGILLEIKAGQRTFRAVDLKQLLTYAALNISEPARPIHRLGLFNPRMGVSFISTLSDVCYQVSGSTASELLQEIIQVISSGDLSR